MSGYNVMFEQMALFCIDWPVFEISTFVGDTKRRGVW